MEELLELEGGQLARDSCCCKSNQIEGDVRRGKRLEIDSLYTWHTIYWADCVRIELGIAAVEAQRA